MRRRVFSTGKESKGAGSLGMLYGLPGVVSWALFLFPDLFCNIPLFLWVVMFCCPLYAPVATVSCLVATRMKRWKKILVAVVNISAFAVAVYGLVYPCVYQSV